MADSWFGRYFAIEARSSTFLGELRAGVVGFLTVAYILAVNAGILSQTAATCTVDDCTGPNAGTIMCKSFSDPGWMACVEDAKRSLIAATAICSFVSCILMGVAANMPLILAPGMGINAYFTYNVVGFWNFNGMLTYKEALATVFVEGWIFLAISLVGVRARLISIVPPSIMYATATGIGFFLSFIGFQGSEGIGLITYDGATLVKLGGCPAEYQFRMFSMTEAQSQDYSYVCPYNTTDPSAQANLGPASANYGCRSGGIMRSPITWLGIFGGGLMVLLMMKNVRASILYGVVFVTIIAWIPGHSASYFGSTSQIPGGEEREDYFKKVVTLPNVGPTALALEFSALATANAWTALITFLYLDFLDATSTMFSMARLMSASIPGFLDEKGHWPRQAMCLLMDGASIVIGSLLGSSPLTVMSESAVPIKEGGRTGITAVVVGCCFGCAMFLSPIFANIPPYATGPALILVGALLAEHAVHIEWDDMRKSVPAFLTMILMPLTYSIAYGVMIGLLVHIALWLADMALEIIRSWFWQCGLVKEGMPVRIILLKGFSPGISAFGGDAFLQRNLPGYAADAAASKKGSGIAAPSAAADLEDDDVQVKGAGAELEMRGGLPPVGAASQLGSRHGTASRRGGGGI